MKLETITFDEFNTNIFKDWNKGWFLLSAGSVANNDFNSMTVSWGFFGFIWGKPAVTVVVRPQRFTLPFMEKYPFFSLSAFPEKYRDTLKFCGANSGKNVPDKARKAGLTPDAEESANAPVFKEAELVLECRKLFVSDMKKNDFLFDEIIKANYPSGDFHRMYTAEITGIKGVAKYVLPKA